MTKFAIIFLSCLAATALAGDVIQLGDDNFADELAKHDLALVKFYAPWCGHCKKMAPELEKAATILKANDPPVACVEVDCTAEGKEICGKHGVSGYPTLKIFRNGELSGDYNGGRSAGDFVKTLAGQAGPASAEIKDVAKFEKLVAGTVPVVIGFFESDKAEGFAAFKKASEELREKSKFAHAFNADVMKAAGQEAGAIAIFRPKPMKSKFEEQVEVYNKGKITQGLVRSWVQETINGLCPVVDAADADSVGYPQVVCIYNVDYVRNAKGTQYWRNRVMKVAQKFADLKFAIGSVATWGAVLHEAGKSGGDGEKPVCLAFADRKEKYLMDEEFSMDSFEAFLNSYKAGELEAHMKSEGAMDNTGKANLDLTAKNWKSHVDGSKDLFVKFYAPWCGHCKTLAPKWEEMAEKFADDDSVVIAHFNADANDVPSGFEVQGFPTMFWVPAGGQPQKYQEGRETKDMVKFVKKNKTGGKKTEL